MKKFLTFVLTIFVLILSCSNLLAATPKKGYVKDNVKNQILKVRKKPNAKNKKYVMELKIGTNVDIVKVSGKWYKIKVSGTKGWVKKKYIKVTEYEYTEEYIATPAVVGFGGTSISPNKIPKMGKTANKVKAKKVESKENIVEEEY